MAYQQSDLDMLQAAIASGVLEVRYADGRTVRYQSIEGMMTAEQRIIGVLASTSTSSSPRRRYPAYRNGC